MTNVSQVTAFDLEGLATLHAQSFDEPWGASAIASLLASPGTFGLKAQGSTGFVLCRSTAGECEVLTIAVAADHRQKGIGAALLDAAITHAAAKGAREVHLEVAADNDAAKALYDRRGFAEVGRRHHYYRRPEGERIDALLLRLDLPDGCTAKAP